MTSWSPVQNGNFSTPEHMLRKTFYLYLLFSLHAFGSSAQNSRVVSGKILDTSGIPVSKASLKMSFTGSGDTLRTITDDNGSFSFIRVPFSSFFLAVTNMGFEKFEKRYSNEAALKSIVLEDIILINQFKMLEEIIITTPIIQMREDTVEYRADSFKVKPNSMVEDLLKKLPGIQVDKNGEVTAQGKKVSKVKVNGKDFFGNDPKTATRELPSDIVDKVQVLDDYGDLAAVSGIKDGEPEKVINLQLKKNKTKGVFGRVTAGYGTEKRYQASMNANIFNNNRQLSIFGNSNNVNYSHFNFGSTGGGQGGGGMGRTMGQTGNVAGSAGTVTVLSNGDMGTIQSYNDGQDGITATHSFGANFRNDFEKSKGSYYGSYSYSDRMNNGFREISQQNFFEDNVFLNDQRTKFSSQSQNHRAYLNFEYRVDSFNYIKISPQLSYVKQFNRSSSNFIYQTKGVITTEGFNGDTAASSTLNLGANLLYNHRFRRKGRNLSMNLNVGIATTESDNDKVNSTNNYNVPDTTDFLLEQRITQDSERRNYGFRINYSEPIAKDRFLDLIYSYSDSYTKNDRKTTTIDSTGNEIFNPVLSNAYKNTFINQRAGLNLRTIKKKYNYTLGVSIQPVNLDGYSITKDSSYTPQKTMNIFPVARMAFNFTRTKTLNFNYYGNSRQPVFSQLQPVRDISNPQYQIQGNPSLKPEIHHNFNLFFNNFNVSSGRVFFTGVNVNLFKNQIVNNTIPLGNAGAQLTIPENVDGYYNLSGFYTYSKPFLNRIYVISVNGTLNYNHNITLIDSQQNIGNNWLAMQGINFEFNHKDWLEWGAGIRYGLNSVQYSLEEQPESDFDSWAISSTIRMDLPGSWILCYDFDYTINNGLSSTVSQNPYILNASLEKQIFRKKNGFIRLSAFDIFNQNTNITRQITGNSIIDTRTNRLGRYGMITFTYRLNRFQGQQTRRDRREAAPVKDMNQ